MPPSKTGRRPKRSDNGPIRNWPIPKPVRKIESTSCGRLASAIANAARMLGSAGSIMSIASGLSAMMEATTTTNSGKPIGRCPDDTQASALTSVTWQPHASRSISTSLRCTIAVSGWRVVGRAWARPTARSGHAEHGLYFHHRAVGRGQYRPARSLRHLFRSRRHAVLRERNDVAIAQILRGFRHEAIVLGTVAAVQRRHRTISEFGLQLDGGGKFARHRSERRRKRGQQPDLASTFGGLLDHRLVRLQDRHRALFARHRLDAGAECRAGEEDAVRAGALGVAADAEKALGHR